MSPSSRIDKGLIEGLMLKRARCTVYMVQETDTLGKDSELASTLAQGKPVVAYVPDESAERVKARLDAKASIHRVTKRLLLLLAEVRDLTPQDRAVMSNFLLLATGYSPLLRLVGGEDEEFIRQHNTEWSAVKKVLAAAESKYFLKRADTLKRQHPLALQVHLETGVANGVLVVRSADDCARLLAQLLTNQCVFSIEREQGVYILREAISKCPFRVVTDDPMLTNSFWEFYWRSATCEAALVPHVSPVRDAGADETIPPCPGGVL